MENIGLGKRLHLILKISYAFNRKDVFEKEFTKQQHSVIDCH